MAFDSRQYEYADMTAVLGGRDITGVRGNKYSEEIEREELYAKGRHPHSMQSGNVKVEGELTVTQDELEALIEAGNGSLLTLKGLSLVTTYGDPLLGDAPITDVVEGIYFLKSEKDFKQGDKFMDVKLPYKALRVRHHVQ